MDVGAAGGVTDNWRDYLPFMDVDCFEPNAEECSRLQRASPSNVHWFPVALAGSSGRRKFYVLNRATGSSLYPPNDAVMLAYTGPSYAGIREVLEIDCLSLSEFLSTHDRPAPNLIKLDTQGSELEILSSLAGAQLEDLFCAEIEVEFVELYSGQPMFGDVHAFMRSNGYRLLDVRTHRSYRILDEQPYHYLRKYLNTSSGSSGLSAELVAGDALYLREPRVEEMSHTTLVKYLGICGMYRFYDLAFWLLDQAVKNGIMTHTQQTELARDLAGSAPRPRVRERADAAGRVSRTVLWALGYDDYETFWTRRSWPNQ